MIKIREANSSDVVGLQSLIQEWIVTRKLFPPPVVHFNDFQNYFGGSNQSYFCVVAEDEDENILVGYALCTFNYAVWLGKSVMLENIFVRKTYRMKGIGKRLLSSVLEHGLKKGCQNVNFYTEEEDESKAFFAKVGAEDKTATEGWLVYTLPHESILSVVDRQN
uniref:Diamine acetyltransferase 2 n=2 Tax=Lygus hesperus TaxID=30085 RepID=A0A0A9ZCD8_LYGHE